MDIEGLLHDNTYPGRGIIVGLSPLGRAVTAYFIMGRSEESQNRVLTRNDETLTVEAFDPKKSKDSSLLHYTALVRSGDSLILSNGDHGELIRAGIQENKSFSDALGNSTFEPDAPHYTPRISALVSLVQPFGYELALIKKGAEGTRRKFFKYSDPTAGGGQLLHTYRGEGNPLASFLGSPREVSIDEDIEQFSQKIWKALNKDNRVGLYVLYTDLADGKTEERLFNRHMR